MAYDRVENWHASQPEGVSEEALMAHAALYLAWLATAGMVCAGEDNAAIDADLAAREVVPLPEALRRSHGQGLGRELFAGLRRQALSAEEGACTWL